MLKNVSLLTSVYVYFFGCVGVQVLVEDIFSELFQETGFLWGIWESVHSFVILYCFVKIEVLDTIILDLVLAEGIKVFRIRQCLLKTQFSPLLR